MTLDEINSLDRKAFVAQVGWVFEKSPWVAERSWIHRPFTSLDQLHGQMTNNVGSASKEQQLALLKAHPDLGARAAMSSSSTSEQAGAGLNRLTAVEYERLHRLNHAYRTKFGFPFLFAVKGSDKHQILAALAKRLEAGPEQEFLEALEQVYRIARYRLEEIVEVHNP